MQATHKVQEAVTQVDGPQIEERRFLTDDDRYLAVETKDRSADGAFIVAVRTTRIYCRPICPSRTPKRHNVSFYETPEQARSGWYRACKRCDPDASAVRDPKVGRGSRRLPVERAEDEAPTLEELGIAAGLSPFHLQRTFKAVMGITPRQYWDARRVGRLKQKPAER